VQLLILPGAEAPQAMFRESFINDITWDNSGVTQTGEVDLTRAKNVLPGRQDASLSGSPAGADLERSY
jgi:hypothetical protein